MKKIFIYFLEKKKICENSKVNLRNFSLSHQKKKCFASNNNGAKFPSYYNNGIKFTPYLTRLIHFIVFYLAFITKHLQFQLQVCLGDVSTSFLHSEEFIFLSIPPCEITHVETKSMECLCMFYCLKVNICISLNFFACRLITILSSSIHPPTISDRLHFPCFKEGMTTA